MKEKAQAIFKHFGEEKQLLKAKEEYLEFQIALMELAKYDIKCKLGVNDKITIIERMKSRDELILNCNEELADNILIMIQLDENMTFDSAYEWHIEEYSCQNLYKLYMLKNLEFNKDEVFKTVNQKIQRTLKRFNIICD